MKKVIAFTGHKLNGKTTASNYLMQRFLEESETPIKVERINFKDSIVDEMNAYFPTILDYIAKITTTQSYIQGEEKEYTIDDLFKEKPPLMRKLMQDFGLMRRKENHNYWIDRWTEKVKASNSDVIIVDDCRFLNEQEAINRVGGKLYKVIREGIENTDNHATEREIDLIECEEIRAKNTDELFNHLDKIRL